MKKKRLEADINFDFTIIGLVCPLKEYKLAWYLNNKLDIKLNKEKDIEIEFVKDQNLLISNYFYETEHSYYRVLKNRSVSEYDDKPAFLLPELNRFDYLILASGYEDTYPIRTLKGILANIPKVQYVQSFPSDSLKSKENLIF